LIAPVQPANPCGSGAAEYETTSTGQSNTRSSDHRTGRSSGSARRDAGQPSLRHPADRRRTTVRIRSDDQLTHQYYWTRPSVYAIWNRSSDKDDSCLFYGISTRSKSTGAITT
jgi:hypothetical protein